MKSTKPNAPSKLAAQPLLPGEDSSASRRAFLQCAGYGLAASLLSGCSRGPVRKVIPYLSAPEGVIPGRAYWMATTCGGCSAACGVLAKCMDGRPIKVEGNPSHRISQGGLCAMGQAEVLTLYDAKRVTSPLHDENPLSWAEVDQELSARLESATSKGRKIRILTGTEHGPSTVQAVESFLSKYPTAKQVSYDGLSKSALLDAHEQTHGRRALPSYEFDRAKVIVSFAADFLGTWISPVAFAADYAKGRRPDQPEGWMSRHIQLESRLSLTGSTADQRFRLAPTEITPVLAALVQRLEEGMGVLGRLTGWTEDPRHGEIAAEIATELLEARGQSLIVCGLNSLVAQCLVAYANELLGNYGKTLSVARPSLQRAEDDRALLKLQQELNAGEVDVLIVSAKNPAYDLPAGFGEALTQAETLVAHSANLDETAALASWILPLPHALESWGDGEPQAGRYSLIQPAVPELRDSRSLRVLLARLCGDTREDHELLRSTWRERVHPRVAAEQDFESFFNQALHDGYVEANLSRLPEPKFRTESIPSPELPPATRGLSLLLYPKIGLLDGRGAHNPWLQELPDPVSKVTWDNYACLSPALAESLGVEDGDVVRIGQEGEAQAIELPALVQRGQHDEVIAVALGYGRLGTDRFAGVGPQWLEGQATVAKGEVIGVNAAPWIRQDAEGHLRYHLSGLTIEATGEQRRLAATQDHHSLEVPHHIAPKHGEVRDAVRSASFAAYVEDPAHALSGGHQPPPAELWPNDHEPRGHHWGMAIDLTSCIGCSACSISCQAENNVPVVGKDEVLRHREMHWMRIDRYYSGDGDELGADFQPMFCQQCDNAPCEGVCPVLATVHSTEGLNQQVYNRCVGTRYCANTCPYKVRRFNWFDYPREEPLANQSLNPDVTVRTRGVMEKCSFCAQRIQEAKNEAKRNGVELDDGDIRVACQQSCPTQAIVFGDLADPESRVSRLSQRQRSYRVLEELNVKPSVRYLGRIRNQEGDNSPGEQHG